MVILRLGVNVGERPAESSRGLPLAHDLRQEDLKRKGYSLERAATCFRWECHIKGLPFSQFLI